MLSQAANPLDCKTSFKPLSYRIYCYAASYISLTDTTSVSLYGHGYIESHTYTIGCCCRLLPQADPQGLFPGAGRWFYDHTQYHEPGIPHFRHSSRSV